MINPEDFMNTQVEGANSTESVQPPNGEYTAVIDDVKIRTPKESVILDVYWLIDDMSGALQAVTGREKNIVRQSIFLDVTTSGGLDMGTGKNVQLGRLRESLGMNEGVFSFPELKGRVAKIRTEQRLHEGVTYCDVKGVAKAA